MILEEIVEEISGSGILSQISVKSVKNRSYPISRVHDCNTITFYILHCASCYDYGFNDKRCWLKILKVSI